MWRWVLMILGEKGSGYQPPRKTRLLSPAYCASHPRDRAQAFQVSRQCVRLWKEGWFQDQEQPSGVTTLRNPKV